MYLWPDAKLRCCISRKQTLDFSVFDQYYQSNVRTNALIALITLAGSLLHSYQMHIYTKTCSVVRIQGP